MKNPTFAAVEREFYQFKDHLHQMRNLIDRRDTLPMVRSSSDFRDQVSGGGISCPVELWLENQEFLDEMIARHRLHVEPLQHMLDYLREGRPEQVVLFELKYRKELKWPAVELEMGISESTRKRMRCDLVWCGARFLGLCGNE
jgi:hypothetical protein